MYNAQVAVLEAEFAALHIWPQKAQRVARTNLAKCSFFLYFTADSRKSRPPHGVVP